ncbi:hypothetical protein F0562_008071 [Nyssa sinensis]|uniref:15-cis-phytoene synthase n=1 Tax=Nyssa sinensis TaxID=561372 RepID=A0A5J5A6W5_9ASTE|nr:hypothetical protein F0562_008071 [Nyssa sinensis]
MGCFFGCFRIKDDHRPQTHIVSDPISSKPREVISRNRLSSLLLSEEKDGSENQGLGTSQPDIDVRELKDEAKFLKACEHTPSSCISNGQNTGRISTSYTEGSGVGNQKNKSVRFECECDVTSFSSRSPSTEVASQNSKQSESAGNYGVSKPSPYPTPLSLTDEMQTPGTVFPAYLENLVNGKNARIRSQYVHSVLNPVENFSQWKWGMRETSVEKELKVEATLSSWLKPLPTNQDGSNQRFDSTSSENARFGLTPGDRPIIGMVAAHWNEDELSRISPKWWDGNGIPNSTNKYKEDQKVSWHATPFEERLEKALSEDSFISQRKHINGTLPVDFDENEESDTALSQLQTSTHFKQRRFKVCSRLNLSTGVSTFSSAVAHPSRSSEERVYEVVLKQAALVREQREESALDLKAAESDGISMTDGDLLNEAYDRCGEVCAEYAKTFYLGTLLMTAERRRAVWAIYVWCRRTDELVDGPNASHITPKALDRWEKRLSDLFEGCPYDMYDAALSDTVSKYPVDIQPFKDMIEGMRLDLKKSRYKNFDELYLYCYYVAGTVGLMSVPVMGIAPESKASTETVYNAALALGIANQLTNILRDVGEDARRGRIYLPQDELAHAGLSADDIFTAKVTDKWRNFMKGQIKRARMFFDEAEKGVVELNSESRWPVWTSLLLYRQILDAIEANDYDNFTKRAYGPMIVAMKGHPGTGKTTLAHSIATALNCPLIDKDDIRDSTATLQQSVLPLISATTATKLLNDLSYEAIWRIASTQLGLGLNVVIDSPLSRRAHLDRLLQLGSSTGAKLIVIECRPQDEEEWRRRLERRGAADGASWHKPSTWQDMESLLEGYGGCSDYDVGDVPKLVLDTTAPVGVFLDRNSAMNRCLPDWNIDGDLPLSNQKKPTGPDHELVELLWQNGQVVLNSQTCRKPGPSTSESRQVQRQDEPTLKASGSFGNSSNLIHDYDTGSWMQYPLDDSFEKELFSNFFSEIPPANPVEAEKPIRQFGEDKFVKFGASFSKNDVSSSPHSEFTPNPMPPPKFQTLGSAQQLPNLASLGKNVNFSHFQPPVRGEVRECSVMTVGSSHCGSNQIANDTDLSRASSSVVGTTGLSAVPIKDNARKVIPQSEKGDTEMLEPAITSSSGGSGSSFGRTCNQSSGTTNSHKRKGRDAEESECQSEAAELESAAGNKPVPRSGTARKSRAAEVHNLSERRRRDRINEKMKALQELIPHSNKSDKASMLDEAIEYLKSLQLQLQMMWMGSGMAPMMFPGIQHYMSRMGMGIGSPPLPSIHSAMHLPRVPVVDQAISMASTPNQAAMCQAPVLNPINYQTQLQNPNFSEQYARYIGFHPMQNASQPMNIFGFGSDTAQQSHTMTPPGTSSIHSAGRNTDDALSGKLG